MFDIPKERYEKMLAEVKSLEDGYRIEENNKLIDKYCSLFLSCLDTTKVQKYGRRIHALDAELNERSVTESQIAKAIYEKFTGVILLYMM